MTLRVLHLVGSPTGDFHERLSLLYARDCLAATRDPERYDVVLAHLAPDGTWRFPDALDDEALVSATPVSVAAAVERLTTSGVDVVVPQLFCLAGMTHVRSLLDLLGLPYVGNRPAVMALTADKALARAVVSAAGVRVPAGEVLRRGERPSLAPPYVVKPVDADNSHGLSLVRDGAEADVALDVAWAHSDRALVETYVELGREVRCGVLERDGELVCLPLEEYAVDPVGKPVRDERDKLAAGADGGLRLVAKDAEHAWILEPAVDPAVDPVTVEVWAAARACYRALGCRHYGLFDFRIDPEGRAWFLEAGLYNSFAPTSVVTVMAAAAGIALPELFAASVAHALTKEP